MDRGLQSRQALEILRPGGEDRQQVQGGIPWRDLLLHYRALRPYRPGYNVPGLQLPGGYRRGRRQLHDLLLPHGGPGAVYPGPHLCAQSILYRRKGVHCLYGPGNGQRRHYPYLQRQNRGHPHPGKNRPHRLHQAGHATEAVLHPVQQVLPGADRRAPELRRLHPAPRQPGLSVPGL